MGQQIVFFDKNKLDISNASAILTASQGQDYVDLVRNRSNSNGWVTTGSVDADNTNIIVDFSEVRSLSDIILIGHNFKAYTIQYWDEISSYINFSTAINETVNTLESTNHHFDTVQTSKIKLRITETMTANEDKYLLQFVATTKIGQFTGYPVLSNVSLDKNRISTPMLSGKKSVIENNGGFTCDLAVPYWNIVADINIIEDLYDALQGFLVWICGGDESQFIAPIVGYRKKDLYLMKCANEYNPDFVKGIYNSGLNLKIKLVEVVD